MKVRFTLGAIALLGILLSANTSALNADPLSTYRIAGIVVDSVTGQPLDGAEVTITLLTTPQEVQTFLTSSGGRFLFTDLPAAKYQLTVSRRGYATQSFHQHEAFATSIVVGPGLDSENIRFPLTPSSVITGVVTDEWGDAVREAKVLLFQQSVFDGSRALRNVNQTMTDDQGRYRFAHLLSGTYAVAVHARPWYAQAESALLEQTLANLRAAISSGEQGDQVVSAAGLRQELNEAILPPSIAPLFDVVYPVTFFPGVTTLAEAGRLAIAPGVTETADFQLHAVPSVHLRVRVPVQPSVAVTITNQQEDGQRATNQEESSTDVAQVDASLDVNATLKIGEGFSEQLDSVRKEVAPGLIELSGIPPGEINVVTASMQGYAARAKTVRVSGNTDVDFSSQGDLADVSGVVLSSQFHSAQANTERSSTDSPSKGREAVLQAIVKASSDVAITFRSLKTNDSYDATISSEGKFSFTGSTLPAGSYEIEFAAQSGLHVSGLEATGATVSGRTIEIPASQPVSVTVHAAEANCSISGFALKNGKPIAGAVVLLVPQDPGHDTSLYHRDQSDSDGSFSMSPLFPGRYILLAIENGWDLEWTDPKVMLQYLPAGQPLELQPNASLTLNPKVQ